MKKIILSILTYTFLCNIANAASFTVPGTNADINSAIVDSNATIENNTLTIGASQTVVAAIATITQNLAILGNNPTPFWAITLGAQRLNFGANTYSVSNLIIQSSTTGAITVASGGSLTINNVTLASNTRSGAANAGGAAISNTGGTVNIDHAAFTSNFVTALGSTGSNTGGGAIYNTGNGTVNIENTTFTSNRATKAQAGTTITAFGGGAIYNANGTVNIDNATFTSNSTTKGGSASFTQNGGGAILNRSTMNIANSTFTSNSASGLSSDTFFGGGAIYNYAGTLTIDNSTFTSNNLPSTGTNSGGGAIYSNTGTLNINNSTFTTNTAAAVGGAIYNNSSGIVNIDNVFFDRNRSTGGAAAGGGGAIYNIGTITIKGSAFTSNASTLGGGGGAIFNNRSVLTDTAIMTISDTVFTSNRGELQGTGGSGAGGAIYNQGGTMTINNSVFTSNTSLGSNAGAIANRDFSPTLLATMTINNSVFTSNSARDNGGAISSSGTLTINGGTFTSNSAGGTGGAIENDNRGVGAILNLNSSLNDITFTNNTANGAPNDIYNDNSSTININGTAGRVILNSGLAGAATSQVLKTLGGEVVLGVGSVNGQYLGSYTQTGGTTTFLGNSFFGGPVSIAGSNLNLFTTSPTMVLNNLALSNANVNSINNVINTFNITNFNVSGVNNFSVDIDGAAETSDQFNFTNTTGTGTINVDNFRVLAAPTAEVIDLTIFTGDIDDLTFTSSETEVLTPIYKYNVASEGEGVYRLFRADAPRGGGGSPFNKQVFRGQVATMASYYNQLLVMDTVFDHVYLDSELYMGARKDGNKYAAINPLFAPYQYSREEGSLWFKTYVTIERLFMTQDLNVNNNAYGSLVGADFPAKSLGEGWKFLPTAYIGYNGGHQTFNGVSMYQNGGQAGFMGTFMKNDYIASILAYAGGYGNEMSVAGVTDKTGNWFAGTAVKQAYNFHPTRHLIVQPTLLAAYNIFGQQRWGSDFGGVSMVSGYLNGINIAPGLNLIYGRESWSVYFTSQYVYNINDKLNGSVANVNLPNLMMRHGYIEYGVGATKSWKERFMGYAQIVFRHGGRNGVGFQLGLMYKL